MKRREGNKRKLWKEKEEEKEEGRKTPANGAVPEQSGAEAHTTLGPAAQDRTLTSPPASRHEARSRPMGGAGQQEQRLGGGLAL